MTLGELILELASIDNNQNIPHSEMMGWEIEIQDCSGKCEILSLYCDEKREKILIDIDWEEANDTP